MTKKGYKQTKEHIKKRIDLRNSYGYFKNEVIPWNKGLTKETNDILKIVGEKNRNHKLGTKQSTKTKGKMAISHIKWWANKDNLSTIKERNLKISEKAGKKLLSISKSKLPKNIGELYLENGYSCEQIAKMCGLSRQTVNSWLDRLGIEKRESIYKNNNKNLGCDDGHIVDSNFEREVDNWLYGHRISHSIHNKIFENRNFLTDFKVGDVFIECDGLMEKRIDKKPFEEKLRLYKENNIKFIIIYPTDDINIKLSILLKYYSKMNNNLKNFIKEKNQQGFDIPIKNNQIN